MSENKIKCHSAFNKLTTDERRSVAYLMGARSRDIDHELGLKVWFQKTIMDTNNNRVHRRFLDVCSKNINELELTNYIYDDSEIQSVLRHSVNSKEKYNPAEDPYYKQESLYVDKEIK